MTLEEEKELVVRGQAGDMDARNAVILSVDEMCWKVARRYSRKPEQIEDMRSYAIQVLCAKFHQFDVNRGVKFLTWATWWIRAAVDRWMSDYGHKGIRLPASIKVDRLLQQSDPKRHMAAAAAKAVRTMHIDLDGKDKDLELPCKRTMQPADDVDRRDRAAFVRKALDRLQPRYREVLELRTHMKLEEVGVRLGVTRERVRQLQMVAEEKFLQQAQIVDSGMVDVIEEEIRDHNRGFMERSAARLAKINQVKEDREVTKKQIVEDCVRELGKGATSSQIRELVATKMVDYPHPYRIHDSDLSLARKAVFGANENAPARRVVRARPEALTVDQFMEINQQSIEFYGSLNAVKEKLKEADEILRFAAQFGGVENLTKAIDLMITLKAS